jgi:hypothetical protein
MWSFQYRMSVGASGTEAMDHALSSASRRGVHFRVAPKYYGQCPLALHPPPTPHIKGRRRRLSKGRTPARLRGIVADVIRRPYERVRPTAARPEGDRGGGRHLTRHAGCSRAPVGPFRRGCVRERWLPSVAKRKALTALKSTQGTTRGPPGCGDSPTAPQTRPPARTPSHACVHSRLTEVRAGMAGSVRRHERNCPICRPGKGSKPPLKRFCGERIHETRIPPSPSPAWTPGAHRVGGPRPPLDPGPSHQLPGSRRLRQSSRPRSRGVATDHLYPDTATRPRTPTGQEPHKPP